MDGAVDGEDHATIPHLLRLWPKSMEVPRVENLGIDEGRDFAI